MKNDYLDEDDDPVHNDGTVDGTEEEYKMKGGMILIKRKRPKIIRSVRFNKNKDPENYCREKIMLCTPWRNEKKDLLKGFETYQDRFETVKDQIEENSKQYENHFEVIDSAVEEIESEESNTIVAPDA